MNVLFNNALNTFYLQLYGDGLMVKDHRDNKRKATSWDTLYNLQQDMFYMHHPTDRTVHSMSLVTPVVEQSNVPLHHKQTL